MSSFLLCRHLHPYVCIHAHTSESIQRSHTLAVGDMLAREWARRTRLDHQGFPATNCQTNSFFFFLFAFSSLSLVLAR